MKSILTFGFLAALAMPASAGDFLCQPTWSGGVLTKHGPCHLAWLPNGDEQSVDQTPNPAPEPDPDPCPYGGDPKKPV